MKGLPFSVSYCLLAKFATLGGSLCYAHPECKLCMCYLMDRHGLQMYTSTFNKFIYIFVYAWKRLNGIKCL